MAFFRIESIDFHTVCIEHPEGRFSYINGEYRDGAFYPHPESLAKCHIDEDALFECLKSDPQCTNTLIEKAE